LSVIIGIRREDKNRWEGRVPLVPRDLADLTDRHGLRFLVQPSDIRKFDDSEFLDAGVEVAESLAPASVILAVKEIPKELLEAGKVYVYFAHVVKGQTYNMPMLKRILDLGCTLIDYERIVDEKNRRLIFFGIHAGYAGMIETLWSLSRRLRALGLPDPFGEVRHAYEYDGLEQAQAHLRGIGEEIGRKGLDPALRPLVFGISGYGNVSRGAQAILDCLPAEQIDPASLPEAAAMGGRSSASLLKVVFEEKDMVQPIEPGAPFELQDYYDHPERYQGCFDRYLPHLDVLVNTIYWDEPYPRLVTREWVRQNYGEGRRPRLQVIGDISCDIGGSIEVTVQVTEPSEPCFTWDPHSDSARLGCEGPGPVVMAVDNLPSEISRESSRHFSETLRGLVPALAAADWTADFWQLDLPPELKTAVIAHRGELAPQYRQLKDLLET